MSNPKNKPVSGITETLRGWDGTPAITLEQQQRGVVGQRAPTSPNRALPTIPMEVVRRPPQGESPEPPLQIVAETVVSSPQAKVTERNREKKKNVGFIKMIGAMFAMVSLVGLVGILLVIIKQEGSNAPKTLEIASLPPAPIVCPPCVAKAEEKAQPALMPTPPPVTLPGDAGPVPFEFSMDIRPEGSVFVGTVLIGDTSSETKRTPLPINPLEFFGPDKDPNGNPIPGAKAQQELSAFRGGYAAILAAYCGGFTEQKEYSGERWRKHWCEPDGRMAFRTTARKAIFFGGVKYAIFVDKSVFTEAWDYINRKWKEPLPALVPLPKAQNNRKRPVKLKTLVPPQYLAASLQLGCGNLSAQAKGAETMVPPGDTVNICFAKEGDAKKK